MGSPASHLRYLGHLWDLCLSTGFHDFWNLRGSPGLVRRGPISDYLNLLKLQNLDVLPGLLKRRLPKNASWNGCKTPTCVSASPISQRENNKNNILPPHKGKLSLQIKLYHLLEHFHRDCRLTFFVQISNHLTEYTLTM